MVEVGTKVGDIVVFAAIEERPGHANIVQFFPIGMPFSSPYATPLRDKIDELVHAYLNREMSKYVEKGRESLYNSTIAIAENFLGKPVLRPREGRRLGAGLIYPSVRAGQIDDENSYNVAIKSTIFDAHYRIVEAKAYRFLTQSEPQLIGAAEVTSDGSLKWDIEVAK